MSRKKKQPDLNVLFGFLSFIAFILYLISFFFDKGGRLFFLVLAYLAGASVLFLDYKTSKARGYARYNALFYIAATFIVFLCVDPYQALILLVLYGAGMVSHDFISKIKTRGRTAVKMILHTNYRMQKRGERQYVLAREMEVGDRIELLSGEIVPVDGVVIEGEATANLKEIDGNSNMITLRRGDTVVSGTTLMTGNILIRATTTFKGGTVSRIVSDHSTLAQSVTPLEKKATFYVNRASAIFFAVVAVVSLLVGIFGEDVKGIAYSFIWLCFICCTDSFRTLLHSAYVVASMRCVNSGVVAKNKKLIEKSIYIKNLLFRKQGVLTDRAASVVKTVPVGGVSSNELITYAAYAHFKASHALTEALVSASTSQIRESQIAQFLETDDNGAMVQLKNGTEIITGSADVLQQYEISCSAPDSEANLCVAVNNKFVGYIVFEFSLKEDIPRCVDSLKFAGAKNLTVITKDAERTAKEVADKSGIKKYICVEDREGLEKAVRDFGKNTVYVGYGKGESYDFGDECVKLMYGGFRYDNERTDGIILSDSLDCVLKFFNIIKDTRWMIIENIAICVIQLVILLNMLLSGSHAVLLGGILFFVLETLRKLNCFRNLKKL